MIVVLHNIRSAYNVGSIFRTAEAMGCQKIYLCGITPTPLDRFGRPENHVLKVSLGAESLVSWVHASRTTRVLDFLRRQGHYVLAVEQHPEARSLDALTMTADERSKVVLVLGNERRGLSPAIIRRSQAIVEIPMAGHKESLNVAVSFGIVAYEIQKFRRRRLTAKKRLRT